MDWTSLYRILTELGAPIIRGILRRRLARGREDPLRFSERKGKPGLPRPAGPLLWLHAVSIGEAQSVLTLIRSIRELYPNLGMIMTTGTVSSARIMADRLPAEVIHQYAPIDRLPWVRNFLAHWRPDAALWIESDLWPNILIECRHAGMPMMMLNARVSERSARLWRLLPGALRPVLEGFQLCLAQDEAQGDRLKSLGAARVKVVGNVKYAADPLPFDPAELAGMRAAIGDRPVWLAASTHQGEEEIVAQVHQTLLRDLPRLMTIIVPRHPSRADSIAEALDRQNLAVARRSRGEVPTTETAIYLADTIGELGLFYRLCRIVFVGGSLIPRGGQNMLEPARLDSALLHGPNCWNFAMIARALDACGGALEVRDADELSARLKVLLQDESESAKMADAASALAREEAKVLGRLLTELEPLLRPLAQATPSQPEA